jgi:serine protease Do
MKTAIFFIAMIFCHTASAQSLSLSRVSKIKTATARITIKGSNSVGTGFLINNEGQMITCWHVISPALFKDSTTNQIGSRKIFAELKNGDTVEYNIPIMFVQDTTLLKNALAYDFCLLIPAKKITAPAFLKPGNFEQVDEGQEVYTCGFPLGISTPFISKGIISTLYTTNILVPTTNGSNSTIFPRRQALLDLTLNKGNSGGAIVKLGKTEEEDAVIGIADFIINPIAGVSDNLNLMFLNATSSGGSFELFGINPIKMFSLFTQLFEHSSVGVSGCVSFNHVMTALGWKNN